MQVRLCFVQTGSHISEEDRYAPGSAARPQGLKRDISETFTDLKINFTFRIPEQRFTAVCFVD